MAEYNTISREQLVSEYSNELRNGYATIFFGAGMSKLGGAPLWSELMEPVADFMGLKIEEITDFYELAERFVQFNNQRTPLTNIVIDQLKRNFNITDNHKIISRLPFNQIWTSNFDDLIEESLKAKGKRVNIISRDVDFTIARNEHIKLYKVHGCIHIQPECLVLTRGDIEGYNTNYKQMKEAFEGALAENTFLFLGFGLKDINFKTILGRLHHHYGKNSRQHYAILSEGQEKFNKELNYEINDLSNYGIKVHIVKNHSEISWVLKDIERAYIRNNVFISGSLQRLETKESKEETHKDFPFIQKKIRVEKYNTQFPFDKTVFGSKTRKEFIEFLSELGEVISKSKYKIFTGYGNGICDVVIEGIANYYAKKEYYRGVFDKVNIFPLPHRFYPEKDQNKNYREGMIGMTGFSVIVRGNTPNSDYCSGTFDEYNIAKGLSRLMLREQNKIVDELKKLDKNKDSGYENKLRKIALSQCALYVEKLEEETYMYNRLIREQWKILVRIIDLCNDQIVDLLSNNKNAEFGNRYKKDVYSQIIKFITQRQEFFYKEFYNYNSLPKTSLWEELSKLEEIIFANCEQSDLKGSDLQELKKINKEYRNYNESNTWRQISELENELLLKKFQSTTQNLTTELEEYKKNIEKLTNFLEPYQKVWEKYLSDKKNQQKNTSDLLEYYVEELEKLDAISKVDQIVEKLNKIIQFIEKTTKQDQKDKSDEILEELNKFIINYKNFNHETEEKKPKDEIIAQKSVELFYVIAAFEKENRDSFKENSFKIQNYLRALKKLIAGDIMYFKVVSIVNEIENMLSCDYVLARKLEIYSKIPKDEKKCKLEEDEKYKRSSEIIEKLFNEDEQIRKNARDLANKTYYEKEEDTKKTGDNPKIEDECLITSYCNWFDNIKNKKKSLEKKNQEFFLCKKIKEKNKVGFSDQEITGLYNSGKIHPFFEKHNKKLFEYMAEIRGIYGKIKICFDFRTGLERLKAQRQFSKISDFRNSSKIEKEYDDKEKGIASTSPFWYDRGDIDQIINFHESYLKRYKDFKKKREFYLSITSKINDFVVEEIGEEKDNDSLKMSKSALINDIEREIKEIESVDSNYDIVSYPYRSGTLILPIGCLGGMAFKLWKEERNRFIQRFAMDERFDFECNFKNHKKINFRDLLIKAYNNLGTQLICKETNTLKPTFKFLTSEIIFLINSFYPQNTKLKLKKLAEKRYSFYMSLQNSNSNLSIVFA